MCIFEEELFVQLFFSIHINQNSVILWAVRTKKKKKLAKNWRHIFETMIIIDIKVISDCCLYYFNNVSLIFFVTEQ